MMKKTKEMLEQRKHILKNRTNKENSNIIKKINRQIIKVDIANASFYKAAKKCKEFIDTHTADELIELEKLES